MNSSKTENFRLTHWLVIPGISIDECALPGKTCLVNFLSCETKGAEQTRWAWVVVRPK